MTGILISEKWQESKEAKVKIEDKALKTLKLNEN